MMKCAYCGMHECGCGANDIVTDPVSFVHTKELGPIKNGEIVWLAFILGSMLFLIWACRGLV